MTSTNTTPAAVLDEITTTAPTAGTARPAITLPTPPTFRRLRLSDLNGNGDRDRDQWGRHHDPRDAWHRADLDHILPGVEAIICGDHSTQPRWSWSLRLTCDARTVLARGGLLRGRPDTLRANADQVGRMLAGVVDADDLRAVLVAHHADAVARSVLRWWECGHDCVGYLRSDPAEGPSRQAEAAHDAAVGLDRLRPGLGGFAFVEDVLLAAADRAGVTGGGLLAVLRASLAARRRTFGQMGIGKPAEGDELVPAPWPLKP
jgi:hypothetical protein